MKWYVVHTYSGHENRARLSLVERIRANGLQDYFGEVLIPTENVLEVRKGQKRTTTRKFYPGYMFVQMVLNDETWHLVKSTPKITGFLGGDRPTPVPESQIEQINTQISEGATKPRPRRPRSTALCASSVSDREASGDEVAWTCMSKKMAASRRIGIR